MNKKKAQRRHAFRRSLERFGFVADTGRIIADIQNGRAKFLRRQSNRVTLWIVTVAGAEAVAVYDKKRQEIVTLYAAGGADGENGTRGANSSGGNRT